MGLFDKIFGRSQKTEAETQKVDHLNPNDIWFTLPTISNEYPQTTSSITESEFEIQLHEDDFRQNEFLNKSSMPFIEQEIAGIKSIWEKFSKKSDEYTLFKNCHVRRIIGEPNLHIQFNELLDLLDVSKTGAVKINNEMLVNGFVLQTKNTTYYGTKFNNTISQLCVSKWNENTTHEIHSINAKFNLVFANWHHAEIIQQND